MNARYCSAFHGYLSGFTRCTDLHLSTPLIILSYISLAINMTIQSASSSISLPLSALLPPQSPNNPIAPHHLLPPSPSAAILGPLPPTTPLHLALNWLALSDLPEYESALSAITPARNDPILASKDDDIVPKIEGTGGSGRRKRVRPRPERVLIITGRKDEFYQALQDEDEDWMRDHGSDYSVIDRLKRVDVR